MTEADATAVDADRATDTIALVITGSEPDDVESLRAAMHAEMSPQILAATAERDAGLLLAGSVPIQKLADGLRGWIAAKAVGVACYYDPEEGVLSVRPEPRAGGGRLTLVEPAGDVSVYELEEVSTADVEAAIRQLLGAAAGRPVEPPRAVASRYLWEPFSGDVAELARYVSPDALRGLGLNAGVPETGSPAADSMTTAQRAARLFDNLARRDIAYAFNPWTGLFRQQIRHPWWLLEDRWGTCLDLAVTYAAMCVQARIGTLLAVPGAHALVVVDPAYDTPRSAAWRRDWGRSENGICEVRDGDALAGLRDDLAAGRLLAVDVVAITAGGSFDQALECGRERLAGGTTLVDVPYLHRQPGFRPLPDPEERRRRPIRTYPQVGLEPVELYPSQQATFDALSHDSGTVVLIGPQGQGKSTLARELIRSAPFGEGWFLNASEPKTLISSLADADQAERNRTATGMSSPDRRGFYDSALQRLMAAPGRWIAVFDNADGDPGKITPLLPQPGPQQLVVVTTTNSQWEQVAGVRVRRLPPIDDARVAQDLGRELVPLVAGRMLLLRAFRALMHSADLSATDVMRHATGGGPSAGPATLWAALRTELGLDDDELRLCVQNAYLPPDRQPLEALEALSPRAREIVARAARAGLLSLEGEPGLVRMHRLFGAAVRADVHATSPELDDDVVLELATAPQAVRDVLDRHGDQDTLMRLDDRLADIDARTPTPDARLGEALHRVAALLELGGHTRRSGETYARAERHVHDRRDLLADVLHSRARTVNQHHARDEVLLREALEWARQAEQMMLETPGRQTGADRCLAMQGLLLQKLAAFPREGETAVQLVHDALDVIEEAHRRRTERLDPLDPELARSEFNLAGPRINLAQREPERAREHLDAAERVYIDVRRRREKIYGRDVHPHIAACIIGEAYVNYYRALLVPAPAATRAAWLRAATERANAALRQREALDGSLDLDESRKVVRFLAKIALARTGPPAAATRTVESVATEVSRELAFAAVETLPSYARDLTGQIAAWLFSPALAAVVQAFGETPPSANTPLAEALEWFEEFSLRWDYRGGKERNLVAPQDLGPEVEEVVLRSAAALGLVGTTLPPAEHYDHVLVLGGLVRACMARPLYAARLVNEGTIKPDAITALGGFRELKGDELELAAKLGHADLSDEFDAMDAGVRSAFALGEPLSERGERLDGVGESWMIREYRTTEGVPVRVVAAPSSEPGVRRANTADTYEWFASQLAHLSGGERILTVTSDIYVPYQHADALRMLGLPPYSAAVDAVGLRPGDAHPDLTQEFKPHNYLQEMRSTIRALGALYDAWSKKTR